MARGRRGVDNLNETLSAENNEIQEELLKDLVDNQEKQVETGSNENNELNNLSNEPAEDTVERPVKYSFNKGDRVKVKSGVTTDTMGRRIHAGLSHYTYTIRTVRPDGIACIECLTHIFNVKLDDLDKIS